MWYWTPIAMVRILGFFLTGILLYEIFGKYFSVNLLWIGSGLMVVIFYLFQIRKFRKWSGIPGLGFILFSGWIITAQFNEKNYANHLLNHQIKTEACIAVLLNEPEKTKNGYRLLLQVRKVRSENYWYHYQTKAYAYLKTEIEAEPGDLLIIKSRLYPILNKKPFETFDYSLYLKRKNIFFQLYPSEKTLYVITNKKTGLKEMAAGIRKWCLSQIKKFIPGSDQQAIASALLIGYSGEMDPELNRHYAVTGTLHILSVSGLHTGLLYWIIILLCKPLRLLKNGEWIIVFIALGILWIYAMVTGLAPSVLRAVIMLSFITVSKPLGLRSNIWNTLASSAFLLLLFDPYLITRISFQLSYLAVAGIAWLHPKFVRLWEPESFLVSSAWTLTCVSIAAQITTLPVTLLNFHQFPLWFIPANLILIPLSSLALFSCLAFLPLSVIPGLANPSGWIVSNLIGIMNAITEFFGVWPLGPFGEIKITAEQAVYLMVIIIGMDRFITSRNFYWLIPLIVSAIAFSLPDMNLT